jgi:hypothetical protein
MERVKVMYEEDGTITVKYDENKRPLKFTVFYVETELGLQRLGQIIAFVQSAANHPKHLAKMTEPKFYALIERLATMACREFRPTTNWGITKPRVRAIVHFTLTKAIEAGEWPERYVFDPDALVQVDWYDE